MKISEINEMQNNHLVTKSNMLIEANYKLGVLEQKIILCLASHITPADSDFKTYTLPIQEFTDLLNLKGKPKYTALRQITKDLMKKGFEVRIEKKVIQVSWLSYVAYNETEGTIDIRFDPFLRPYLLQLKREFTSYKLENVVKLKSSYAIRIYELLKQYERLRERSFYLEDLRKMLGAEDIYPAYGNFKQRVLVPAQKELKAKTDISFEIEEIRTGRRVDKIKFFITSGSNGKADPLDLLQNHLQEFADTFIEKVKKLGLNLGVRLTDEIILSWEKHGQDNVVSLLEKIQDRKDIENPVGYITKVLKASNKDDESEDILVRLVSDFRKSKEVLPAWYIREKSIEKMEEVLKLDHESAAVTFEEIKEELFGALQIQEPEAESDSIEELEKRKRKFEKQLKKLKKGTH
ncbi:Initiator Replication protein [Bacillus sp. OV322]|uniref:replication initiation protein n=1 Tax=Bacillus sp. OV322 TaxID=1882764 RepID=UPI0008DF640E|nr:replication initiation protein [Bacillus sp. OV322]SFD03708.1 Initiator Replication protein [Bacillus sp. OV322]